jgi:hypothetical protein
MAMIVTIKYFGCHIIKSTTVTVGTLRTGADALLGKTKISYSDMSFRIEKDIFRLQIAVNNAQPVHITDCQNDFGSIELRRRLGKPSNFTKVKKSSPPGQ